MAERRSRTPPVVVAVEPYEAYVLEAAAAAYGGGTQVVVMVSMAWLGDAGMVGKS